MQISSCLWGFLFRVLIKVLILFLLFFFSFYLFINACKYVHVLSQLGVLCKTRTAHVSQRTIICCLIGTQSAHISVCTYIHTHLCDQTQSAVLYLHVMIVIGIFYSLFSYIDLLWCYAGFGSVLYVYLTVRWPSYLSHHFIPFVGCQPAMCTCSVTNKWRSDLVRGLVQSSQVPTM